VLIGTPEWHALIETGRGLDRSALQRIQLDTDDPINIQYTSGTTGFPKGATLSHHNILNNAFFVGELCHYTAADRICIPVPFYHCFGMVMGNLSATSHGACMIIPAPRYVHIVDEFPMTVTGKVRKVEMRERSVEILGLGD